MIAVIRRQILGHFLVAIQTLEGWRLCPKLVAACALRRPRQRLVRFGERTWRDLPRSGASKTH